MKLQTFAAATCATLALGVAGMATAATFTFNDRASFDAATGLVIEHSRGAVPRYTTSAPYSDGLTVSNPDGNEIASTSNFTSTTHGMTNPILISGVEDLDFDFSSEVFGFGLSLFEPSFTGINGCNTSSCAESTFVFSLFDGTELVGSETLAPANNATLFFGVTSSLGFDRVEMRETVGSNDNEWFGEFVSSASLAPVPLPLPATLLLGALGGLGFLRRRASR